MITEQEVRVALEAQAALAPSRSGSLAAVLDKGRRRRKVSRLGRVAAALVLILGLGLTLIALDQRGNHVATDPTVTVPDIGAGLIFPVPEFPPDAALSARFGEPGSAEIIAAVGDVSGGGLAEGTIIVISEAATSPVTPEGEHVEVDGRPGRLLLFTEWDPDIQTVEITWQQGRLRVSVLSRDGNIERTLRVAESVTLTQTDNLDPATVSVGNLEGATIVAGPQLIEPRSMPAVDVLMGRPSISAPGVRVQIRQEPAAYIAASSGAAEPVTVRGRPAYFLPLTGAGILGLVWDEQPGLTIFIEEIDVPVAADALLDMTKIAEGIRLVDEPTWHRHLDTANLDNNG